MRASCWCANSRSASRDARCDCEAETVACCFSGSIWTSGWPTRTRSPAITMICRTNPSTCGWMLVERSDLTVATNSLVCAIGFGATVIVLTSIAGNAPRPPPGPPPPGPPCCPPPPHASAAVHTNTQRNVRCISRRFYLETHGASFTVLSAGESILPFEDTLEALPDCAEDSLDGALHSLLDGPLMNRAQARGDVVAFLEVLRVGRTSVDRTQVRNVAEILASHVTGRFERVRRQPLRGAAHEIRPDWKRDSCARTAFPDACRLVVAHPHASDDRGVEADEPGIVIVVGGSRLAADGTVHAKPARCCAGAPIDDVLEHRQHLKRDLWCEHLLGFDVGAMHEIAVGVVHFDKPARPDAVTESREHRIGRGQFERCDETAAKRQRGDVML